MSGARLIAVAELPAILEICFPHPSLSRRIAERRWIQRLIDAQRKGKLIVTDEAGIEQPYSDETIALLYVRWNDIFDADGWLVALKTANIRATKNPDLTESLHSSTNTHKIITKRNPLSAVIANAKSMAKDKDDSQSVWAELVRLANLDKDHRPAPLLEFIEGEGVKYQGDNGIEFVTKKNLRDRMRRGRLAESRKSAQ